MGRGDRKTKKGKIFRGSYGNSRPKIKNIETAEATVKTKEKAKSE